MTAFFTDTGTDMMLTRRDAAAAEVTQTLVRMKLENASRPRSITGAQRLPGISNYFIGNDPKKWRTDVPHYAGVKYEGVYPGIDLVWYGNQRLLEYDFVLRPGADPQQIRWLTRAWSR